MKKIVIGILAHVDAGKTTLSEAMLYKCGSIRSLGRVDNKDAFLDTYTLERERGITIFSKQARIKTESLSITLLDTPGHVDFSSEMERTLQVLDYAILVINGADGVQGHTVTLWSLLRKYKIPVFLFVNKMDQNGTDSKKLLLELQSRLNENCIDFSEKKENFYEQAAMSDEAALEEYLENGILTDEVLRELIYKRKIFPCFFGSALKLTGVEEFLSGLETYTKEPDFKKDFGAKVFKITRDEQGNRLTFMKVTGGSLKVKSFLVEEEKVNQIRIYSGEKFEAVSEVQAGDVCAVMGPLKTYPGQGIGVESASGMPVLEPVLTCSIQLPEGCDVAVMLPKLRQLEEEDPMLHIIWNESLQEIQAQIMGEIQIEILKSMILERFGVAVEFGSGNIVYKETIKNSVEGVGHFEPLKHYAEVHLLLEPAETGSGLSFFTDCSEDMLAKNWQRLILTHLEEKEHKGVLTGAAITDMKITLVAGRAHLKHTEGGDFRQATYRALRQGLKQAESVLLEPYYEYRLEVPETVIGRAMTDLEKRCGTFEIAGNNDGTAVLTGMVPAVNMQDYQTEVSAYTKGQGRLFMSLKGYLPCHNAQEVIEKAGYDSERDLENPTGSVFCAHGAGFVVEWNRVKEYMHVDSGLDFSEQNQDKVSLDRHEGNAGTASAEMTIGTEEIDQILERTFHANTKDKTNGKARTPWKKKPAYVPAKTSEWKPKQAEKKEQYLLVDGYNILFAWEELAELAKINIDSARGQLLDTLCDYQAMKGCQLIVVFDAYRVKGHAEEVTDYHNIHVVYTKEAETADQYIEKFAHENGSKYQVTVATSDGLEQIIIRGQGCLLVSARELREEVERTKQFVREEYIEKQQTGKNRLMEGIMPDIVDN
ncbi:MAG: TetM/TetW/TetO/TetS family tetracycline resistance ribosomal protection protein [Lachnospiraceae bacterium]|nr:TetM/TetW/TetO/TetS family tetracycline resistance ribosomal protection protein [Lachnospiraceae bacterium]